MSSPLRVFVALILGALLGYACKHSPSPLFHDLPALIEPFARLFINAILVCVIPLVTTSLIAGCASTNSAKLGRLAGRSLTVILCFLVAAAGFAGAIAFPLFHYLSRVMGRGFTGTATFSIPAVAAPTFGSFLAGLLRTALFFLWFFLPLHWDSPLRAFQTLSAAFSPASSARWQTASPFLLAAFSKRFRLESFVFP
jgi:Na+/H+-dicarboxylate symporter